MSRALLASWQVHEFGPGLYPERRDGKDGALDRWLGRLLGRWAQRGSPLRVRRLRRFAERCAALADDLGSASEDELQRRATALRATLASNGPRDEHAAESFALIREVCARRLGLRHYPVQLMGGYALLRGTLAEMQTGEGKTLTAVLPAITIALTGAAVHVITVNAYLARRDAEHLAPVYAFFGLRVGLIVPEQDNAQRAQAYRCDVTYCVNKDIVFDYLRDRITAKHTLGGARAVVGNWLSSASERSPALLRGLYYAIVDEADSVLIDEARTPLIISSNVDDPHGRALYAQALALAGSLVNGEHYRLRADEHSVELTDAGRTVVGEFAHGLSGLWAISRAREELVEQGLSALHLFACDRHYIISEGKIQIVDEYTGRVMADRSWERGLHQMIEVKEGLDLSERRETISRITYQRYFRRYLCLAGMSGTATEVAPEMRSVYALDVLRIPPNRPVIRRDLGQRVFRDGDQRWAAIAERAAQMRQAGRPVLIGTRSVAASERASQHLTAAGLEHEVLNARQDAREAEIIGQAGQPGRITVATNMAGRGTDILLAQAVRAAGGLHVILSEYHDSARIDRQLFGRAGRQGDPGSCEAIVALDDELFVAHAARLLAWLRTRVSPDGLLPERLGRLLRRYAQAAAERQNSRIRRQTVELDKRMEQSLAFAGKGE
ncbi:MAG TPA: preprotein translocase subunit SecA [Accumulibacter sp.]|uniref:preprotein translocase subunit SecA n=1 Tax=Accumulibacter sp. TaxID=2053492 RepID=UPI00287A897F|nr:preprotein translocase subunit SecA [Accumulibacter sp.]MDS4055133.1 preprotein translocase subunit SecA [Accumulibacter sp.]HMV06516.1 preprotein translocase subunit SecA [Accumulibacter sp.]HMW64941.1 preprotein translocase subunit SecA [Accumulibacter sp.]HMW80386.1 preprotein translocase subunit SecA [Accumulibacter sp.]HNC26716.1 preprotein translocase subunit SecA [Accumulibacter sp.]